MDLSISTPADETTPLLGDEPQARVGALNSSENVRNGLVATSTDGLAAEIVQTPASEDSDVVKPQVSLVAVMAPMILGIFLVAMDVTIVTSTYASIGSQFEQLQNSSWIATGYMLSMTSFQPLYGKLSDIFGRKSCLIFAYTIFALGCLFCGLARNMTELIAARALAGIGGGGMTTLASIVMSDVAPLRKRGTLQGFGNIAFAAGQATGAPLGGFLADSIGWRWAFLIQVPLTVLAILSVGFGLKLPRSYTGDFRVKLARIDFAEAATLPGKTGLPLPPYRHPPSSWSDLLQSSCVASIRNPRKPLGIRLASSLADRKSTAFSAFFFDNQRWLAAPSNASSSKRVNAQLSRGHSVDAVYSPAAETSVRSFRQAEVLTPRRLAKIYAQLAKSNLTVLIMLTAMSGVALSPLTTTVPVLLSTALGTALSLRLRHASHPRDRQLQVQPHDASCQGPQGLLEVLHRGKHLAYCASALR
ncbi:hypothetical protein NUW54_g10580 [Trametes sanguinea]|uniref:Uncharacterized protein n=1 Tax=Trametes sanguinea TaxID=158606 RepID=A0ACC1NZM7_9APHY|nr:hypothetical protein NUW54_g10580 [Trametes sanguinea]